MERSVHKPMVRHRVETEHSMAVVLEEIRRREEPLYGVVEGALGLRVLERLQVVRPFSVAAEPRVQVWRMRTEMRELSQVAGHHAAAGYVRITSF